MADFFEILFTDQHSYRVLFTVRDDKVIIHHIRHAARDVAQPEDMS